MLGFHLGFWDYLTFVSLAIMAIAVAVVIVFVGSLPGRIAIARKHPDAEAVSIMGWAGLIFALPWNRGVRLGVQAYKRGGYTVLSQTRTGKHQRRNRAPLGQSQTD